MGGIRGIEKLDGVFPNAKVREAQITAVVTRADGTTENLGVVSYWHRNPLRRWFHKLTELLK